MTGTAPQIVNNYLSELDGALIGVPEEVRTEIVAGIREELDGLDAARAARRIEELGDPAFIAAEARAASVGDGTEPAPNRALPIVAAALISLGGVVVPVLGIIAGMVLVVYSRAWTRREKVIAILGPLAIGAVWFLVQAIVSGIGAAASQTATTTGQFTGTSIGINPLVPSYHLAILFVLYVLYFIDGIVLLVLAKRRNWRV